VKETKMLTKIANTIRGLSIDAIDAANSGHPGLPLGCAEIAAYLYGKGLRHNPKNPDWIDRDRFILSAGHGSMLLYSSLFLSGYDISLEDIKNFRQINYPTAGHPEYGSIKGIETTTGPLGQGFAAAAGMALGHKMLEGQLNINKNTFQASFFVLAGDGCIMEGITSEAASLAGHLKLDNLIVIYDSNDICLDGPTSECLSENTKLRFEAYGWNTIEIDGHNLDEIEQAVEAARDHKGSPTLIIAKTIIGKGSPSFQGTNEIHGKPLGKEESIQTKKSLSFPSEQTFFVPEDVKEYFSDRQAQLQSTELEWQKNFDIWKNSNPEKAQLLKELQNKQLPNNIDDILKSTEIKANVATRESSNAILQILHDTIPFLIGGSADLSGSDKTFIKKSGIVSANDYSARNIKYGVREFAMCAMTYGLALHGHFLPLCGTFLTFSDYMRNAIRLSCLMSLPVIFQFTHDSIYLGEDGPTHQPIEHLASLRAIPNLTLIRPADTNEVKGAWSVILKSDSPVALSLSRQNIEELPNSSFELVSKGAYIVKKESKNIIDWCILSSGPEVALALKVAAKLEAEGKSIRVVSFPSFELFEKQDKKYKQDILPNEAQNYCSIEAASSMGWHKYVGKDGVCISIDEFGLSANANDLAQHFGFTVDQIIKKLINKSI
jgi:transketolase